MEFTLTYYCSGCKTFKPKLEFKSNRDNISQFKTCSNCHRRLANYLDHILIELLEDAQENGLEFNFCYEIIIDDHSSTKEIANNVVGLIEDIDKYNW
ncbi:24027_t:CDS:2, partial [Racocetra persica]